jgi:hypothetical protein
LGYLCFIGFDRKRRFQLQHTIIMETGGMKGRRKEMIREELHMSNFVQVLAFQPSILNMV